MVPRPAFRVGKAPITGRFFCFAFVAGAALTQTLAELPGPVARAALVAAILLAALARGCAPLGS